ncbi:MAG: hypothetical protein H0V07_10275 [Propionibacteriales bacterium]|nr:hypothetical protein [Propionibacteriales bacterium]
MSRSCIAAVMAVVLIGCGSATPRSAASRASSDQPQTAATSGLRGRTAMAPGCPLEQLGRPCRSLAVSAHIEVRKPGGSSVVGQVDSDADGSFTIDLPAGRYTVTASVDHGVPSPQTTRLSATVSTNRYTPVLLTFDSGIRGPASPH